MGTMLTAHAGTMTSSPMGRDFQRVFADDLLEMLEPRGIPTLDDLAPGLDGASVDGRTLSDWLVRLRGIPRRRRPTLYELYGLEAGSRLVLAQGEVHRWVQAELGTLALRDLDAPRDSDVVVTVPDGEALTEGPIEAEHLEGLLEGSDVRLRHDDVLTFFGGTLADLAVVADKADTDGESVVFERA